MAKTKLMLLLATLVGGVIIAAYFFRGSEVRVNVDEFSSLRPASRSSLNDISDPKVEPPDLNIGHPTNYASDGLMDAADSDAISRLTPWVEDIFFAGGRKQYHLRDRLVTISSEKLRDFIIGREDPTRESNSLDYPNSEFDLELFPNDSVRVNITEFSAGENGTYSAWGELVGREQSQVKFFVNSAGRIKASIGIGEFDYRIVATPEANYYLMVKTTAAEITDAAKN